jgi:hypothetical protein
MIAVGASMERKLAAMLCADVYGYSRLMEADEEATHRTLTSHRKVIDGLIERHHGRFVNSAGDSVLAEFASVHWGLPSRGRVKSRWCQLPAIGTIIRIKPGEVGSRPWLTRILNQRPQRNWRN